MTELTKIWEKNDQKISDMKIKNERKNSTESISPVSPVQGTGDGNSPGIKYSPRLQPLEKVPVLPTI
jgi:hypothetical protein